VWEVSHTGGHRFAPTAVLLPWGQALARLSDATAADVLAASLTNEIPLDLLGPTHDRGRSGLAPALQAAESFVRHLVGETLLPAFTTEADAGPGATGDAITRATVRHADGREWLVRITRRNTGNQRPESCGKASVDVHEYEVTLAG
jgi:hypothetical protein